LSALLLAKQEASETHNPQPETMNTPHYKIPCLKSVAWLCAMVLWPATVTTGSAAGSVSASTSNSASHIVFANPGTLVGGAVFGNAGTYDGIPFSLWPVPYTTAKALGSGVSAVATAFNASTPLGGDGQYATVVYSSIGVGGSLTVSGLDSAKRYLFQIGFCDKRVGSYPYNVSATVTLSDDTTAPTPLAFGATTTADDYALLTATVAGTTSLKLTLPQAANLVGPIIGGFAVHVLPPLAPTGLAATAANQTVALAWTASPGATGYNVKRSTTSGSGYTTVGSPTGTSYNDTGLTNGTPYYYVVSATNGAGEGADSIEASATPAPVMADQTITFTLGASVSKLTTDAPFADTATASSGLAVTYASDDTNVATVNANTGEVIIVSSGTAHILADQAGNGSFHPAPQASQELIVDKSDQTITFALGEAVIKHRSEGPFADTAAASSGLAVSYASDNTSVATVDANTGAVALVGPGTAHILVDQAGNATYNAAPQVSQTLTVGNVGVATSYSASHIVFANPQALMGAAVFGNAGTYDGIPFSLWAAPYTTAKTLGAEVSVVASPSWNSITGGLGGDGQYATVAYPSTNAAGSLTFSGLDSDKQYLFQIGFSDKRVGAAGCPYSVLATLTLSDDTTALMPLSIGAATTSDDYALLTVTVSGTTSLKLDLPTAANGVGPIIGGFAVHASPPPPTELAATPANQTIALTWTASPGATGYNVKRSTTSGSGYSTIGTPTGASYNDTGLTNGTPYYYVVSATNGTGESVNSAELVATPAPVMAYQTITFTLGASVSKLATDAPFADSATASSGLAVTYTSDDTNVATVDANTGVVTIVSSGTVHILADQAGNGSFHAAPQASQELIVDKVDQSIAFALGVAVIKHWNEGSFADTAAASSGLAVSYASDNSSVATVDANTGAVVLIGAGTAHILVDQAGNGIYNAAPQVSQTLTVGNVGAASSNSANHIVFDNSQTLVGAAVFGNVGTYDGIPFSLWAAPFSTTKALGSGVSVVASPSWNSIDELLGGDGQYAAVAYAAATNSAGSLTVGGLDSAKQYLFQIGFCDTRTNYPYNVLATLTLSDNTTASTPLAFGASPTSDDYALLTVTVSGTTSLKLDLPMATNGVGPIIGGFAVHQFPSAAGSYAAWAASHAENQAADLDSDNDGVANGVEFFMGEADGFTATPVVVNTAGTLIWTWPRDPAAAASFMFQVSDNLSAWTDIAPPDSRIDTTNPNQVTLTLPRDATSKFFRLAVVPTP
jgi:uncharacterized protein YjdB